MLIRSMRMLFSPLWGECRLIERARPRAALFPAPDREGKTQRLLFNSTSLVKCFFSLKKKMLRKLNSMQT